jgi:hypothetical protein
VSLGSCLLSQVDVVKRVETDNIKKTHPDSVDRERCQMSIKPLLSFLRNGLRERVDFWNGRSRFFYPGGGAYKTVVCFVLFDSIVKQTPDVTDTL